MTLVLIALAATAAILSLTGVSFADSSERHRTVGTGLIKFKGKGPEAWFHRYRKEKAEKLDAYKLLRTAQRAQRRVWKRDVTYAITLASSTFGVSASEMWAVARCETGSTFNPYAQNRSSSASGLFQFLDSTWASQGLAGFSVFDPVANALATARIVARQGWRQWSCQP